MRFRIKGVAGRGGRGRGVTRAGAAHPARVRRRYANSRRQVNSRGPGHDWTVSAGRELFRDRLREIIEDIESNPARTSSPVLKYLNLTGQ